MPPKDPARTAAQRSVCLLLAEMADLMPGESITVRATDGYHEIETVIRPCRYSLADAPPQAEGSSRQQEPPAPPHLTPLDRLILECAPAEPVTLTALARLCDDHEPDSYFQARVRRLARAGLVVRDFRGYRRA